MEKYLKARLEAETLAVPKIHDLEVLLGLLAHVEPLWVGWKRPLRQLTHYAVTSRYPGMNADRAAATESFQSCLRLRELARQSLGL